MKKSIRFLTAILTIVLVSVMCFTVSAAKTQFTDVDENNKERIVIYNKSDKIEHKKDGIYVSALNNDLDILKKEIFTKLGLSQKDFLNPSLVNDRQIGLLEQMKQNILKAKEDAYNMLPVDLISISIELFLNNKAISGILALYIAI